MSVQIRSRPSSLYADVGKNISRFRKELSLSQAELASQVGITQSLIATIEIGTRRISLEDAVKVAEVLHVSIDQLLPASHESKKPGPKPKIAVAYDKLNQLSEKDQSVVMAMIDSLSAKSVPSA